MTTFVLLLALLAAVVYVDGWITIFSKAGYSSLWGLAMLIPPLNVVGFLYLAYGKWPDAGRRRRETDG